MWNGNANFYKAQVKVMAKSTTTQKTRRTMRGKPIESTSRESIIAELVQQSKQFTTLKDKHLKEVGN